MFSKSQDDRNPAARTGQVSVLASDLIITGVVASEGSVELHGLIEGELAASVLTVGANGTMKGRVQADMVDVHGRIEGAVHCAILTLHETARLQADVQSPRLIIENGAEVEGSFSRPAPAQPATPPAPQPIPEAAAPAKDDSDQDEDTSLDTPAE